MIDESITLGTINRLRIDRFVVPGLFLMAEDESDLLLPNQYVTDEMKLDDELEVFVYTDSEDRLVATTDRPVAMRDEFGFFEVVDTATFGAFVNWGLPKDLLVPKNRQKTPMKVGEKRFLRVIKDDRSDRLIGVEKISQYLDKPPMINSNTPVSLLVIAKTPLGFKVIVDNLYEGLLYHDEIFQELSIGDLTNGFIKMVRKDGTIDVSLQKIGTARKGDDSDKVLRLLDEKRGILPYNYKSDPETIKEVFGLSRKAFKRCLTALIDAGKIEVNEKGIFKK
ncbi:MAG: S1-like domain-containing RNA-binding protein [Campylobacterota bacterium]|nr:S1-like domain-containing RNA-binding protein [Campylobacterota bacterium]